MINRTVFKKEKAELVFLKVTENIFKVEKDRRGIFSGMLYVSYKDVLDSLNQYDTLIKNDELGLSSHSNFLVKEGIS